MDFRPITLIPNHLGCTNRLHVSHLLNKIENWRTGNFPHIFSKCIYVWQCFKQNSKYEMANEFCSDFFSVLNSNRNENFAICVLNERNNSSSISGNSSCNDGGALVFGRNLVQWVLYFLPSSLLLSRCVWVYVLIPAELASIACIVIWVL